MAMSVFPGYPRKSPVGRVDMYKPRTQTPWYGSAPPPPQQPIQTTNELIYGPRSAEDYEALQKYFSDVDRITGDFQQRYGSGQRPTEEYLQSYGIKKPEMKSMTPEWKRPSLEVLPAPFRYQDRSPQRATVKPTPSYPPIIYRPFGK